MYQFFEMNHAALAPWRKFAEAGSAMWRASPWAESPIGRAADASLQMFERLTRRYAKPEFNTSTTVIKGKSIPVTQNAIWQKPFCTLQHFSKATKTQQEKVLLVAPMSGHFATLLRDTVEAFLPTHDVYVTDWADARDVPVSDGRFDLDDYTDYLIEMFHHLGRRVHVVAVCQPSVPVLAAVTLMSRNKDKLVPKSMTLMGGPIDTRKSPTAVNKLADEKDLAWFRQNFIMDVPAPARGRGRAVYPGFLQLSGFMAMNAERHMKAHRELFWNMFEGDALRAAKHKLFYDEYLSVMDLTAEFYLQTVERVFIHRDFPNGTYAYRGQPLDPAIIKETALLTVEGERDDISGRGQTEATHELVKGLPKTKREHHLQMGVGHYGVFSGSKFRDGILPVMSSFMAKHA